MRWLFGCEESQICTEEFRKLGHEAYSCDLLPTSGNHPEWHLQMDVFEAIKLKQWDFIVVFPPCTYLTISANKWYKDQPPRKSGVLVGAERRKARAEAIDFVKRLIAAGVNAIENPIGVLSTAIRKPDQVIQPWMFGHGETKATCLWLYGLPLLKPTEIVDGREQRLHKLPNTPDRATIRSKTFPGVARGMALQWGGDITKSI